MEKTASPQGRWIKIPDMVFDGILLLFSLYMLQWLIPQQTGIALRLSPGFSFFLLLFLELIAIMYMGTLYAEFQQRKGARKKVPAWVTAVFFFAVNGMFLTLMITSLFLKASHLDFLQSMMAVRHWEMMFIFIMTIPVILGFLVSFPDENGKSNQSAIIFLPMTVFMIFLLILFGNIWHDLHFGYAMLFLAGTALVTAGPFFIGWSIRRVVREKPQWTEYTVQGWKKLILPALVAVMFVLWQDYTLMTMAKAVINNRLEVSEMHLWISLIVSGVIPMRMLVLLTPPFRWINLLTGAAVMYLYLMSMKNLFPVYQSMIW